MRPVNLVNRRFGHLRPLHRVANTAWGTTVWACQCDCGNTTEVTRSNLHSGTTKSCGCLKHQPAHNSIDLSGKVIGRLTVLRRAKKDKPNQARWLCQCRCGRKIVIRSSNILAGTKSCGCLQSEAAKGVNWTGKVDLPGSYYAQMRCNAKRRGLRLDISIDQLWDLFVEQRGRCALTGVKLRFKKGSKRLGIQSQTASLDRINSRKGYTLDNVQWVHKIVQLMKNKYPQKTFIHICKLVTQLHGGDNG